MDDFVWLDDSTHTKSKKVLHMCAIYSTLLAFDSPFIEPFISFELFVCASLLAAKGPLSEGYGIR